MWKTRPLERIFHLYLAPLRAVITFRLERT